MEEYFIAQGAALILHALKGQKKKAQIKAVCLKIYKAIQATFAGDPDFAG